MQPTRNYKALAAAVIGIIGAAGLAAGGWFGWRQLLRHGPPMRSEDWPPYLIILGGICVSGVVAWLALRALDRLGVRPPE